MSSRDILFSAAGVAGAAPEYVDDVFSTWLYTGNGSTQTITNGVNLAGKGGLVWIKSRSATTNHSWFNTIQGATKIQQSNTTAATITDVNSLTAFNSNGFTLGSGSTAGSQVNVSSATYASWTFREQPKFFDIVTYTGNGVVGRTIPHNLGSVPGMIVVLKVGAITEFITYHRSLGATQSLNLNGELAPFTGVTLWNSTEPTSSVFTVSDNGNVNGAGVTYVAYLFAHDAGGFGAAGTDNVISCGTFTTDGSGNSPLVTLGYEPQFVMAKRVNNTGGWFMWDIMRGMPVSGNASWVHANTNSAEFNNTVAARPSSTGFTVEAVAASSPYIYMTIRRPMKPPTVGTQVFSPVARTGTGANATVSSGFVTDTVIEGNRASTTAGTKFGAWNRLRGAGYNITNTTAAEVAAATTIIQANPWDVMDGYKVGTTSTLTNASGNTFINWMVKRATGFHDVVCYTGNNAARNITHNLGVAPELIIIKNRVQATNWLVSSTLFSSPNSDYLRMELNAAKATFANLFVAPTTTTFGFGAGDAAWSGINASGNTYVAYLFATLPGISKVGSYTGNGTSQTINCGFTTGARFVLIKRTNDVANWWVWDTARGMVSGTNPRLALNTTGAEFNNNFVFTATNGFELVGADASINASGNNYIFLAIA